LSVRKAGITGLAVATSVAFLLSGPVLDLSQRRDPIALAVAVASVTSWYSALAILLRRARPSWTSFAWFGFAAGLTHIYAVDRSMPSTVKNTCRLDCEPIFNRRSIRDCKVWDLQNKPKFGTTDTRKMWGSTPPLFPSQSEGGTASAWIEIELTPVALGGFA
jgi:hypothetical protein